MRPLLLARLWIAIGWLFVGAVVAGSLTTVPDDVAALSVNDKLLHVVTYFVVMGWFAQIWRPGGVLRGHALFLLGLGVALELLQEAGGRRNADAFDALSNAGGILLGWLTSRTRVSGALQAVEASILRSPASRRDA